MRLRTRIALLLLIAIVGTGTWVFLDARSSDPVDTSDAVRQFRAAPGSGQVSGGPAPGVYTYDASGREVGGAGPIDIERELPATATLVVTPDGDGWFAELNYSRQHIEGARYRRDADGGIRITRRRTKVTFAGVGRDDRRDLVPAGRFMPADPAVGQEWTETYRTGDISVLTTHRIERAERVRVGDREVDTLVLVSRSVTTGAHPGTRVETIAWSPELVLPVRWEVRMDIGGTFGFEADTRLGLRSVVPSV